METRNGVNGVDDRNGVRRYIDHACPALRDFHLFENRKCLFQLRQSAVRHRFRRNRIEHAVIFEGRRLIEIPATRYAPFIVELARQTQIERTPLVPQSRQEFQRVAERCRNDVDDILKAVCDRISTIQTLADSKTI